MKPCGLYPNHPGSHLQRSVAQDTLLICGPWHRDERRLDPLISLPQEWIWIGSSKNEMILSFFIMKKLVFFRFSSLKIEANRTPHLKVSNDASEVRFSNFSRSCQVRGLPSKRRDDSGGHLSCLEQLGLDKENRLRSTLDSPLHQAQSQKSARFPSSFAEFVVSGASWLSRCARPLSDRVDFAAWSLEMS